MICSGINQLETAAAAFCIKTPASTGAIGNFIHLDMNDVGYNLSQIVRAAHLVGHRQGQGFATSRERTRNRTESVSGVERKIVRQETDWIFGQDQVSTRGERSAVGNCIIYSAIQAPVTHIDASGSTIPKLYILVVGLTGQGGIHDFVDNHVGHLRRVVRTTRRRKL